jgi:hypothetical protein
LYFLNFYETEKNECKIYVRAHDGKEEKLEGIAAVEDESGDNAL